MNRTAVTRIKLGSPIQGVVVNKHRPQEGETRHHTLTLRHDDASITKVIVPASVWSRLTLGDTYVLP